MTDTDTMAAFETAYVERVDAGADPEDIQEALARLQRRAEQLRVARAERGDGGDD